MLHDNPTLALEILWLDFDFFVPRSEVDLQKPFLCCKWFRQIYVIYLKYMINKELINKIITFHNLLKFLSEIFYLLFSNF